MGPPNSQQKKSGLLQSFNMENFLKSLPGEQAQYLATLQNTQGFNEFIAEREVTRRDDPAIKLFDEIIVSKRNRGKSSFFSKLSMATRFLLFLSQLSSRLPPLLLTLETPTHLTSCLCSFETAFPHPFFLGSMSIF